MTDSHELPEYSEIKAMLERGGIVPEPAEVHGLLSALLCSHDDAQSVWLKELMPEFAADDLLQAETKTLLEGLAGVVKVQLQGADFSYELLLPEDDEKMGQRLNGLGQWCQGFYLGLGIAGIKDLEQLPEDSREVVHDMTEIAQIDSYENDEAGDVSEEDENAYFELVEYLRVGVLLIFEELSKPENVTKH